MQYTQEIKKKRMISLKKSAYSSIGYSSRWKVWRNFSDITLRDFLYDIEWNYVPSWYLSKSFVRAQVRDTKICP